MSSLPGQITTIPGQITTVLWQVITLPGQLTTLPASTVTLPGQITTLSGKITTLPGVTITVPASTVTLPPQDTTLPGAVTTITASSQITTLGGQITTSPGSADTVVLPGQLTTSIGQTVTLPEATPLITIPGPISTIAGPPEPTVILPPVSDTITVPEPLFVRPELAVVVCPKPSNTPGVVVIPQDSGPNALWGCSPGYVCNAPKPAGCDVFADPPDYDYLCAAKYCVLSPPLPVLTWPEGETSYYPLTEGYFNLNPQAFGLDFTIFVYNVLVITVPGKNGDEGLQTIPGGGQYSSQASLSHFESASTPTFTVGRQSSAYTKPTVSAYAYRREARQEHAHVEKESLRAQNAHHVLKRDETIAPAVCFATCNNCYTEAQSVGKSSALCASDSSFRSYYDACQSCADSNSATPRRSLSVYVEPKFAEFLNFCDSQVALPVLADPSTESVPITSTVVPPPVTESVVVATETVQTPTVSVGFTSQVPLGTDTATTTSNFPPVATPDSTTESPGLFSSSASSPPSATLAPAQVTGLATIVQSMSSGLLISTVLFSVLAVLL